jgi:hypothetical protein
MDINDIVDPMDPKPGTQMGELAEGVPRAAERDRVKERRDIIAQEMWDQYCAYHRI